MSQTGVTQSQATRILSQSFFESAVTKPGHTVTKCHKMSQNMIFFQKFKQCITVHNKEIEKIVYISTIESGLRYKLVAMKVIFEDRAIFVGQRGVNIIKNRNRNHFIALVTYIIFVKLNNSSLSEYCK